MGKAWRITKSLTRGDVMKVPKYELIPEGDVYRIRALRDIPLHGVKAGDLGGLVSYDFTLDQYGECWVGFGAKALGLSRVMHNAAVLDQALVHGKAQLWDNSKVSGCAEIDDAARLHNSAHVLGNAIVYEASRIGDNAVVGGDARINNFAWVFGNANVSGNALISECARIKGDTVIDGDSVIKGITVLGEDQDIKSTPIYQAAESKEGAIVWQHL